MKGQSVFFGMQWRNPESFERPGLFTWQELMIVQRVPCLAVPGGVGMRPYGLFGWCNDSSMVLLLSV